MANITTQTIRVDLSTDKVLPTAFTHQNDTARTLVFDMYNGGMPYTMTGNTVKFAYKSPIVNGQYSIVAGASMASGTVSGNKVSVTLPAAYTQISGVGMLTMVITPSSGTIRPVNIRFVVQPSADGADSIASSSDFPTSLEEYVTNYLDNNAILIDKTLTYPNRAAEAKATGDNIENLELAIARAKSGMYTKSETDAAIAAYVVRFFEQVSSGIEIRHAEWHQCPESVRNYLAEASTLYPNAASSVTCVDRYAPNYINIPDAESIANSKPIGYTIDSTTFYDNEPDIPVPFLTEHTMGTLTALDFLRWYNTTLASPAAGSIYPRGKNCRDLGGWNCDGGTIKYGKLVRGSEPNVADKELMVDKIGIRTEVQLLPVSEQATAYKKTSPWGIDWAGNDTENVTVYSPADVSDSDKKALWAKVLTDIIDSVIYGKPVYFHCGVGADRTGVTAMVLEGILGVSRANIDMDFELTNFAIGWQNINGNIYRSRAYPTYVSTMDAFASIPLVGGLTDSFRNRCISFALSLGISRAKINSFRREMIDGSPEEIVLANVYSIAKTLRYCSIDSTATEVDEASTFTATITPNAGYTMRNATVRITMGGTNITSQCYSNGVISIPSVSGDISITATAVALPNLFDSSEASYNYRIRGSGDMAASNGRLVTGVIPISDVTTFSVKGITEVAAADNVYAQLAVYSGTSGDATDFLKLNSYSAATYTFDIASIKNDYPTAAYARLALVLSTTAISTEDTADLEIYGA